MVEALVQQTNSFPERHALNYLLVRDVDPDIAIAKLRE